MRYFNNLSKMRNARNYSLYDLSKLTGLRKVTLSAYEIGQNPITMKSLESFVVIFECYPSEFFCVGKSLLAPKDFHLSRYKNMNNRVSATLRTMRKIRNLTKTDISIVSGLGERTISMIMKSRILINMRHIELLSKALEFPIEEILD